MTNLRDVVFERYRRQHRLHAVLIELTHRCPCDCRHCFLVRDPRGELDTDEVLDLLRQIRDEGAFNLGLTGGEPFLRPDLEAILLAARSHSFFTTLLTTGLLIGPPEVALLRRAEVKRLEISLLGAVAETHDAIMRRPGALAKTVAAVRLLKDAGLGVTLKATVLSPNRAELPAMHDLARSLGVEFSATVSVAPRTDGDVAPLDLALTKAELAEVDLKLVSGGLIPDEDFSGGALLTCQAGNTVAGISPEGDVYPCILFRRRVGNIRERSVQAIWRDEPDPFLVELRDFREEDCRECLDCGLRTHCRRCPGVAFTETGRLGAASPSACALAESLAAARGGDPAAK